MAVLYAILIISALGLIAGIILAFASKFFFVPTDERAEKIRECLPGANCGACGYAGCDGYAAAINEGSAQPDLCTPGGADTAAKLSALLGVEIKTEKKVAFVRCTRTENASKDFAYSGISSCAAASLLYGGPLSCKYGCLSLGDCVKVCDYGAIELDGGVAKIIRDKCVGCGKCEKVCPKGIITVLPLTEKPTVACSSPQKGAEVRKICEKGCIGCKKCEKSCESGAITVINNLAVIDKDKCTACGRCVTECPVKCIK